MRALQALRLVLAAIVTVTACSGPGPAGHGKPRTAPLASPQTVGCDQIIQQAGQPGGRLVLGVLAVPRPTWSRPPRPRPGHGPSSPNGGSPSGRQPGRADHRSGDVAAPRRHRLGKQSRRRHPVNRAGNPDRMAAGELGRLPPGTGTGCRPHARRPLMTLSPLAVSCSTCSPETVTPSSWRASLRLCTRGTTLSPARCSSALPRTRWTGAGPAGLTRCAWRATRTVPARVRLPRPGQQEVPVCGAGRGCRPRRDRTGLAR